MSLPVWCHFLSGPMFFPGVCPQEGGGVGDLVLAHWLKVASWYGLMEKWPSGWKWLPVMAFWRTPTPPLILTSSGGHGSGHYVSYLNAFLFVLLKPSTDNYESFHEFIMCSRYTRGEYNGHFQFLYRYIEFVLVQLCGFDWCNTDGQNHSAGKEEIGNSLAPLNR